LPIAARYTSSIVADFFSFVHLANFIRFVPTLLVGLRADNASGPFCFGRAADGLAFDVPARQL
jgi:hypothetical protein